MPLPSRLARALPRLVAALTLATAATGCASLPQHVERPESQALAATERTALHSLVQQRRAEASAPGTPSGFALLDGPQAAYGSRLALVEAAQKTLDLQYYTLHSDTSSDRLLQAVREAAGRGVRVRILLDDFHITGRDALVLELAYVPNIELRLFNPLAGARDSAVWRVLNSLTDIQRIQQRMHNKLFIADNALGITGGRNLGDAYFGLGDTANFIDLDVLAAGPIVRELSRSFDSYWNNERAYPAPVLVSQVELAAIRAREAKADERDGKDDASPPAPKRPTWDQRAMDLRRVPLVWAPSAMLADAPAKIPADAQAAAGAKPDAPTSPAGQLPQGETVIDGVLDAIGEAQKDLLVVSSYFVPGEDMKKAFADARARGVRVRVLTNSLASNDAPIAHVGYARHRLDLLDAGVALYEMRSDQAGLRSALGSSSAGAAGASRAMLHSKLLVRDGQLVVIGSMNLDLRSQLQNTEIALLIRSRALAAEATALIERSLREGAWRVERDGARGDLVWRAPAGSGLPDARTEPDTSLALRLLLRVIGPLAPDEML